MPAPDNSRPRIQSSPSPGISGAIKDAIAAVAGAVAPKSITQRKAAIDTAVDSAQGDDSIGRMKQAQSTDRDNSYSY
jgi:hypothetical protein